MKNPQLYLQRAWNKRNKLYAEGNKLYAEGDKLCAEGDKLYEEGGKLWAEGGKLYAEGGKLRAAGDLLWINAIIKAYGPQTEIKYTSEGCEVMGVIFKY